MTVTLGASPPAARARKPERKRRRVRRTSSLASHGEPMVWLTGGSLGLCLVMIFGLLALVAHHGGRTFWPRPIRLVEDLQGNVLLGEVTESDSFAPDEGLLASLPEEHATALRAEIAAGDGEVGRRLLRTENFELTGVHYHWIDDPFVAEERTPEWALVVERRDKGRFYGFPTGFLVEGRRLAETPPAIWEKLREHEGAVLERFDRALQLEEIDLGRANRAMNDARLELREVELDEGIDSAAWRAQKVEHDRRVEGVQAEFERITGEIGRLRAVNANYQLELETVEGQQTLVGVADVVRAVPVNQLGLHDKLSVYLDRWWEFLTEDPRHANSEGGVWPAIFGTVVMTLLMTVVVVPFGVLAALYLREYAKQGALVSLVRIAVNNLAGVPSIVFGVFGFGFFCQILGVGIDELLFSATLPNPTYGKGGLMWASLTLALLTLPVVIVATEEALSAVPNSMREGSYACGATKWQTIRRIVLPRAQPGIMTGMILAVARGAGEVAPLMLVGAAKWAPSLAVDLAQFPYVFPERSFMHLGFHIYDVGFQSQNSEAARPLVYTTTLLLIGIVVVLNLVAVWIRARMRRRLHGAR